MYAPSSASSGVGVTPPARFPRASAVTAAASPWDAEDVAFVGMEYSNMGACSQNVPASRHPAFAAGGCSQTWTTSFDPSSAGRVCDYRSGVGTSARSLGTFGNANSVVSHPFGPEAPFSGGPVSTPASGPAPAPFQGVICPPSNNYCQVKGCKYTASSVQSTSPGAFCESHLRGGMQQRGCNDRIYGVPRSSLRPGDTTRPTLENTYTTDVYVESTNSIDGDIETGSDQPFVGAEQGRAAMCSVPACSPDNSFERQVAPREHVANFVADKEHDSKPGVGSGVMAPLFFKNTMCEHPGCHKTARYGPLSGPMILCVGHKRAGMYTTKRDGRMLRSVRDGDAITASSPPPSVVVCQYAEGAPLEKVDVTLATIQRKSEDPARTPSSPTLWVQGQDSLNSLASERSSAEREGVRSSKHVARRASSSTSRSRANGIGKTPPSPRATARPAPKRAAAKRVGGPKAKIQRQRNDTAWTPSASSLNSQAPVSRKTCEVPGCKTQPSYGPAGTRRPRFCLEHKAKEHIGLKNRPCLFPGCHTRPHYGLSQGRPVYCATHKKANMVHLLKESQKMERDRVARSRELSRQTVAEEKRRRDAAAAAGPTSDVSDFVDEFDSDKEQAGEFEVMRRRSAHCLSKEESKRSASRRRGCSGGGKAKDRKAASGRSRRKTSARSPTSLWQSSASVPDTYEDGGPPGSHSDEDPGPRFSHLPDGFANGMAPAVEIRALQLARESARAAVQASGSSRRPRAPSRKLLEASGMLESEVGAQWTTREIKLADAKVKKELRVQRKHFKAAGLKVGEVIQAFSGDPEAGGGDEVVVVAPPGSSAKKQAAAGAFPSTAASGETHIKRAWVVSEGEAGKGNGGKVSSEVGAAASHTKRSRLSRGTAVVAAAGNVHAVLGKRNARGGGGEGKGREDGGEGGRSGDAAKCEYDGCSKTATFGVNGTVRYCKSHRLFGMYEIRPTR